MSVPHLFSRHMLWIPCAFLGIFLVTVFLRPLLPIDETRYLTVAWEMFLRQDWLAPLTKNGEPYHHKPPLLFWMVNAVWALAGPSRWAATIPPVLMGLFSVYLSMLLAARLFPRQPHIAARLPWVMMGCIPFLLYSSMIMFDVTMMFFVLLTLWGLLSFARTQAWRYVLLMGLAMGLGVLTKGPVAYLYVAFPMLLAPLWQGQPLNKLRWYGGCLSAVLLSVVPVLFWLVPVLQQSDNHFAFWLVWEQTAGRMTGSFNAAHARPFYFYIPVLALLLMPWIFFPSFWRQARLLRQKTHGDDGVRFLLCWLVPVIVSLCAISGKQPHYLVPLLPGMALLVTLLLKDVSTRALQRVAAAAYIIFILAHVVGAQTFFKNYDLMPIARYVQAHKEQDWAYVKQYHGEVTFLGRLTHPLDEIQPEDVDAWFDQHPQGYALIRFTERDSPAHLTLIMEIPYRGKRMGIFRKEGAQSQMRLQQNSYKVALDRYLDEGGQPALMLLYAYMLKNFRHI